MRHVNAKPKGGNNMSEPMEFPQGIFIKAPADAAPDFVKGKIQMKLDEALPWIKSKADSGEQWLSLDIKEGRSGKWYASVDTWKPKEKSIGEKYRDGEMKKIDPMPDDDLPW